MQLIDNCLPSELFKILTDKVFQGSTPWFYIPNTASPNVTNKDVFDFSWAHHAVINEKNNSDLAEITRIVYAVAMEKANVTPGRLFRARYGLITALNQHKIHKPHIDYDFNHKVGLLYLNTTDGDTLLYNARYDTNLSISSEEYENRKLDFSVEHSIKPIANRFVLFDGNQYHSSSAPTLESCRVVLNLDIVYDL